jgi:uncharacterized protein
LKQQINYTHPTKMYIRTLIILLFSMALFANYSKAQEGYKKFYYDNNVISSEGTLRQGKPDGYWKTYYKSGIIKSEGNRKDFALDSTWKFYDEAGKITSAWNYTAGKRSGEKKNYNTKGQITSIENYKNDAKNGETTLLRPTDGKVLSLIPFIDGKEDGMGLEMDTMGNITSIITYKMGSIAKQERINKTDRKGKQGVWKTFHKDTKATFVVATEATYTNDTLNGFYKEYDKLGSLVKAEKYVNGKLDVNAPEVVKLDIKTEYFPDGRVKSSYAVNKDGKKQGTMREYTDSGTVSNSKIYQDDFLVAEGVLDDKGARQGVWKEYYTNGTLRSKGEYKEGIKFGEWVFYHSNGEIEQKGKYTKKGKPDGLWRWYFANKQLEREETYAKGLSEGEVKEYNENGALILKGQYEEGQETGEWLIDAGDYKETGTYKAGVKEGEWKGVYKSNGQLAFKGTFIDGNANEKHIYYFENGTERMVGKYIMGNKEGNWNYNFSDGSEALVIQYNAGIEMKVDGTRVDKIDMTDGVEKPATKGKGLGLE